MKTLTFYKWDNFNGWYENYLIAKYLPHAVHACAYWNNKKTQFL